MKTSDQGRTALEMEEGIVLRAYRDVVGVWTIGCGLTAASAVVKPGPGMVITRDEADALLIKALARYEADVEKTMTLVTSPNVVRPSQQAFDAGVSFHFHTGAIAKCSWVGLWKQRTTDLAITAAMCLWAKAGGKVLPALKARREREAAMLLHGVYRSTAIAHAPGTSHPIYAKWGLALSPVEIRAVFDGLRQLGYDPGIGGDLVRRDAVTQFQTDHGLTADGIIGRATLSTLQRALNARTKTVAPAAALVTAPLVGGLADQMTAIPHAEAVAVALATVWVAQHAWSYRDIVATKLAPTLPRFAAYLRSF